MLMAAVRNIQINIRNFHVCYEDQSSFRDNEFQIGVLFREIVFQTKNDKNEAINENLIDKLIKLEGFGIYLNFNNVSSLKHCLRNFFNIYFSPAIFSCSSVIRGEECFSQEVDTDE